MGLFTAFAPRRRDATAHVGKRGSPWNRDTSMPSSAPLHAHMHVPHHVHALPERPATRAHTCPPRPVRMLEGPPGSWC